MNANGVLVSMNFASMSGFADERFVGGEDKELLLACVQTYNDWHVDVWAGTIRARSSPPPSWRCGTYPCAHQG